MPTCRGCGAKIEWVETPAGKRMPVDAEPTADGNIVIDENGIAHVLPKEDAAAHPDKLYRSHFSSRPNAAGHRRPRAT